jgi:hypothetical protein
MSRKTEREKKKAGCEQFGKVLIKKMGIRRRRRRRDTHFEEIREE